MSACASIVRRPLLARTHGTGIFYHGSCPQYLELLQLPVTFYRDGQGFQVCRFGGKPVHGQCETSILPGAACLSP